MNTSEPASHSQRWFLQLLDISGKALFHVRSAQHVPANVMLHHCQQLNSTTHTLTQTESNLRQDLNNLKWGLFPQTSHTVNRCLTPKNKLKKRSAHTYTLPICPHCSVRPPASEMTIAIVAVHEEAGTTPSLHSLLLL